MIIKADQVEPFDFDGLKITDYTTGLDEGSSFAVISVAPRVSHKWSWSNRSDKYYYIISGEIRFLINDTETDLATGDFCIIKKGEKFKYTNHTSEAVRMVLVHTPNFKLDQEVFE